MAKTFSFGFGDKIPGGGTGLDTYARYEHVDAASRQEAEEIVRAKFPGEVFKFTGMMSDGMSNLNTVDTSFIEPGYGPWW